VGSARVDAARPQVGAVIRQEGNQVDRVLRLILIGLVAGGLLLTGVSLAAGGSGEFKPGKGCGDKNHHHYRVDECKKHH
jgi:hypothetical protein